MIVVTGKGIERTNESVIEPNMLDMLPPPADCNKKQRDAAIGWYVGQGRAALGQYLENTQKRIYREYYGNPRKRLVGKKLVHLYAMREIIHEALRTLGVPTHGTPTADRLDKIVASQKVATVMLPSGTSVAADYVTLDKLDTRMRNTGHYRL